MTKITKKIVFALALVLTMGLAMGMTSEAKGAKKVTITAPTKKSTYTITRKDENVKKQLKVSVKGLKNKAVKFKSSKPSVVSVSSNGVLTGKKRGTATITVTSKAKKNVKDSVKITVKQAVTSVKASVKKPLSTYKDVVTLVKGKTYTISDKVKPSDANNKDVSYKSSKSSIAKVTSKGKIYAKKTGKAKITVAAKDGSKVKDTFTVYVTAKIKKKVSSVTAVADKNILIAGETTTVKATVAPSKATCKKVAFGSSNTKVAKVDEVTGKVTAVAPGKATITVKALDGSKKSAKVEITVVALTKVTLKDNAKVTATVEFTDKAQLEKDVEELLKLSGLKKDSKKVVTINGKNYTATFDGTDLKFDGKSISEVASKSADVTVTVGAESKKFITTLQMASFVAAKEYKVTVKVGKHSFTSFKTGAPYMSVTLDGKSYDFYIENGEFYIVGDVTADLADFKDIADIVVVK